METPSLRDSKPGGLCGSGGDGGGGCGCGCGAVVPVVAAKYPGDSGGGGCGGWARAAAARARRRTVRELGCFAATASFSLPTVAGAGRPRRSAAVAAIGGGVGGVGGRGDVRAGAAATTGDTVSATLAVVTVDPAATVWGAWRSLLLHETVSGCCRPRWISARSSAAPRRPRGGGIVR